jgi:hypothetical protein
MSTRPFTITLLRRHPEHGYWTAHVTNGHTIEVDKRFGSWQAVVRDRPGSRKVHREFVLPHVAAALQAKVRVLEKRERNGEPEQADGTIASELAGFEAQMETRP